MRAVRAALAVAVVFAVTLGCRSRPKPDESIRATVTCASALVEPVLDCEIEHLKGTRGANVCWVVECECSGKRRVSSKRLCQAVLPETTVRRSIALSDLGACDRAVKTSVLELAVTPL